MENNLRLCLLCYHKNITEIYKPEWVEQYKSSIINQTYKEFDIIECNYGGGTERIFENSIYESKELPTFVHCLNYLLDKCFELGYDFVFNSNADDVNSIERIEKQLPYLMSGYDLVSANFSLINDNGIVHTHYFDKLNIAKELSVNNNIVCHPLVVYSKWFWEHNEYIPEQLPVEDMELWKRAINNSRFIILPDNLLKHRLHNQSVCQSSNR